MNKHGITTELRNCAVVAGASEVNAEVWGGEAEGKIQNSEVEWTVMGSSCPS